jgi:hypothetical protein
MPCLGRGSRGLNVWIYLNGWSNCWPYSVGVVVVAAAAASYWIFQTLAKGWLDARFSERLERLRHSQAVELENLRLEISKTLDRSTKLLNKELEVLPTCWSLFDAAYLDMKRVCSWLRRSVDVERMSDTQLKELLDSMELLDSQKQEILGSARRSDTYEKYETHLWLHRANQSYAEFHNFIMRSGVFVRPQISAKFDEAAEKLATALRLRRLMTEPNMNIPSVRDELDGALIRGDELHLEIRKDVQNLWFADQPSVHT